MPSMSPPPGLTAYNLPANPASRMFQQDRPADRTGTAARAGHRNRPGIQQRLQAGHICAFALFAGFIGGTRLGAAAPGGGHQ